MNFLETRDKEIDRLTTALNKLIDKQKENYSLLIKRNSNDFIFIHNLLLVKAIDNEISKTNTVIEQLKQFNYLKVIGSKRKRLVTGELANEFVRTDVDFKTDGKWMIDKKCTLKQIENISDAFCFDDKEKFFHTLHDITDNKSLTDRYTRYFFKSSVKHSKNTKKKPTI